MRVSTEAQSTDRHQEDLLDAGVRRDDLDTDHGVSRAWVSRPQFDRGLDALIEGDTPIVTNLDRLGRFAQRMLTFVGGRPRRITASQIRNAIRLVGGGEPAAQVAGDLGMSRATFHTRSGALPS
ncbi:recombinase family protein [Arthrobacter bambusae]|uniref:recombinase family protein n=1 Tax=Arthrobacter bambusae TaxID=1338426 RepID=UPI0027D90041|nr:recombinase family protein [Arthrobacter bambusae]